MQRLQQALIVTAALAFATVCVALALAAQSAHPSVGKSEDCGTYRSDSIYAKGKVVAIRGVSCRKAREVAKRFDHSGRTRGPWKCAYGHGGRALFSCGYGDDRGDIRDWPHALKAVGVGSPA